MDNLPTTTSIQEHLDNSSLYIANAYKHLSNAVQHFANSAISDVKFNMLQNQEDPKTIESFNSNVDCVRFEKAVINVITVKMKDGTEYRRIAGE